MGEGFERAGPSQAALFVPDPPRGSRTQLSAFLKRRQALRRWWWRVRRQWLMALVTLEDIIRGDHRRDRRTSTDVRGEQGRAQPDGSGAWWTDRVDDPRPQPRASTGSFPDGGGRRRPPVFVHPRGADLIPEGEPGLHLPTAVPFEGGRGRGTASTAAAPDEGRMTVAQWHCGGRRPVAAAAPASGATAPRRPNHQRAAAPDIQRAAAPDIQRAPAPDIQRAAGTPISNRAAGAPVLRSVRGRVSTDPRSAGTRACLRVPGGARPPAGHPAADRAHEAFARHRVPRSSRRAIPMERSGIPGLAEDGAARATAGRAPAGGHRPQWGAEARSAPAMREAGARRRPSSRFAARGSPASTAALMWQTSARRGALPVRACRRRGSRSSTPSPSALRGPSRRAFSPPASGAKAEHQGPAGIVCGGCLRPRRKRGAALLHQHDELRMAGP